MLSNQKRQADRSILYHLHQTWAEMLYFLLLVGQRQVRKAPSDDVSH